ncbi:MAG: hypothetical protein ACPGF7_00450 [Pontibacterium sp.]
MKLLFLILGIGFVLLLITSGLSFAVARTPVPSGPFTVESVNLITQWRSAVDKNQAHQNSLSGLQMWYPVPWSASSGDKNGAPVVFYFASGAVDNHNLIQDLVSQGLVVVALIENQYQVFDFSSESAYQNTLHLAKQSLDRRTRDAVSVLNWLELSNSQAVNPVLPVSLSLTSVATLGYSFSGAVAAEACHKDHRFQAAVNLDGWLFGQSLAQGVPCKFLMFSDGSAEPGDADLNAAELSRRYSARLTRDVFQSLYQYMPIQGGIFLRLANSGHRNFTDRQLSSWLHRTGWPGRISGARAALIINRYVSDFFQETLVDKSSVLLQANSPDYPEISLKRWHKKDQVLSGETGNL